MRLIECYVDGFGKISGQKYSFNDGLNVFKEDNGYGKTTLSVFIKSMLYGLDETKKTKLEENDRKHYLPWSGERFGGYLIFSANGKRYRIERSFSSKASDDSFALYDLKTGKESDDYSEKLGEELFGIDADGFERTVFLSERNLSVKNDNKSISAKLSDLVGVDGDVGGLDKALSILEERRKFYQKRGGAGKIREIKTEISDVDSKIALITRLKDSLPQKEERKKQLLTELHILEEKREKLDAYKQRGNYEKQYRSLAKEQQESEEKLIKLKSFFAKKLPTAEEIRKAERCCDEYKHLTLLSKPEEKNDSQNLSPELLNEYIELSKKNEQKARNENKSFLLWYFLTILIIPTSVMLGAFVNSFLYTGCLLSLVFLVFGNLSLKRYKSFKASKKVLIPIHDFIKDYQKTSELSGSLTDTLLTIKAKQEALLELEKEAREEREINAARCEVLRKSYEEFLSLFPTQSDDPFNEIRIALNEYDYLSQLSQSQKSRLSQFIHNFGINTADNRKHEDIEEVDTASVYDNIKRLQSELIMLEREYATDLSEISQLDELEEKKAELTDLYERAMKTHDTILLTKEHLEKAKTSLTSKYLGKTRAAFSTYISAMSNEDAELLMMDTDFGISRSEGGKSFAFEAYSLGTRDFYSIASRLALTDSLYEKEKPFIILDDPFVHFDDARTSRALSTLKRLAEDRQIIYFTCSKSRVV